MDNYYQVLQVAPNAEPEVIAGAYARLSKKYHPDLNPSPDAIERMKAINAAYAVLSDPVKRAQYDQTLALPASKSPITPQPAVVTSPAGPTQTKTFCVNHPETETYLRCNKCGKPVCMKCVQRTPVGYRCNECLGMQRAGYYSATVVDYVIAFVVALVLGSIGAVAMSLFNLGFFSIIIAIFVGPIAGGIVSEVIRRVTSKRRGRYLALAACAALVLGAAAVLFVPALPFLLRGRPDVLVRVIANIGFWIFLAVAVSTLYARLRV